MVSLVQNRVIVKLALIVVNSAPKNVTLIGRSQKIIKEKIALTGLRVGSTNQWLRDQEEVSLGKFGELKYIREIIIFVYFVVKLNVY